ELGAGSFEEEVAWLLQNWKRKTKNLSVEKLHSLHGPAPSALVAAVHAAAGAEVELFACPLTVHSHMAAYCSSERRHQLFGATLDAYGHKWTGVNFARPPPVPDEIEKAVRWALASAREESGVPTLTVLLLPQGTEGAPYKHWLQYPEAVELALFPPYFLPRERLTVAEAPCGRSAALATALLQSATKLDAEPWWSRTGPQSRPGMICQAHGQVLP
ncbi:hypothetical protein ABPG75_002774, partial [Micractinium tetrahymenae]